MTSTNHSADVLAVLADLGNHVESADHVDDVAQPEVDSGPPPTDAEVDRVVGQIVGGEPIPPTAGGRGNRGFTPRLSRFDVDRLVVRPAWHSVEPPAPITEAADALEAAASAVTTAGAELDQLASDRAAERAALRRALEQGAKAPRSTDWGHEEVAREVRLEIAEKRLRQARTAYDAAVRDALPAWRQAIGAEVDKARQAAAQALRAARPAFSRWRELVAAQEQLVAKLDPETHARLVRLEREAKALRAAGSPGLDNALALATSDHPVLSGRVFAEDQGPGVVPRHVRRWAAQDGGHAAALWLASLEASEGWSVSQYARGLWPEVAPHVREGEVLDTPWAPQR